MIRNRPHSIFGGALRTALILAAVWASALPADGRPARAADGGRGRRAEVLSGTFSGMVVTLFLPKEQVQPWLPAGLKVAAECPYKDRPVIVFVGTIDDLAREKVRTVRPRFGRHYLETFIAVPYLQLEMQPDSPPVFHFVRVYTDNAKATEWGVQKYGWPKVLTNIQTTDDNYRILPDGKNPCLSAVMDSGQAKPVDLTNASLKAIRGMLAQPMVLNHDGVYHRYSFDWHFESATMNSTPVSLEINEGFLPKIQPLKGKFGGVADADFGSFYIECRYTKVAF